jgi:hypothetical protein
VYRFRVWYTVTYNDAMFGPVSDETVVVAESADHARSSAEVMLLTNNPHRTVTIHRVELVGRVVTLKDFPYGSVILSEPVGGEPALYIYEERIDVRMLINWFKVYRPELLA